MGQYFKFVNVVTGVVSTASVKRNGDLPWEKNLHRGTDGEIKEDFDEACLKNGWSLPDVVAVGDYGDVVFFEGDRVVKTTVEFARKIFSGLERFPSLKEIWPISDEDGEA